MGGAAWGALQGDGAGAFCLIDGRVLLGAFFGGGGAFGGAGVQALLSGVYAFVFLNRKQSNNNFYYTLAFLKYESFYVKCFFTRDFLANIVLYKSVNICNRVQLELPF